MQNECFVKRFLFKIIHTHDLPECGQHIVFSFGYIQIQIQIKNKRILTTLALKVDEKQLKRVER